MAKVLTDPASGNPVVVAQTGAELALLAHGRERGGQLVLLEAYYAVRGDCVILPQNISVHGARRVRAALEQAAESHQQAQHRRRGFRLVRNGARAPRPPRTTSDRRDP